MTYKEALDRVERLRAAIRLMLHRRNYATHDLWWYQWELGIAEEALEHKKGTIPPWG